MAGRKTNLVHGLGTKDVLISGSFAPITNSQFIPSTDGYDAYGPGWQAHRDGVGLYRVQLDDSWVMVEYVSVTLVQDNPQVDAALVLPQILGPIGGEDGRTLNIRTCNTSNAPTELDQFDRICFQVVVDASSVVDRRDSDR